MRSYLTFREGEALVPPEKTRHYQTDPVGPSPPPVSRAVSTSMKSNKASGTRPEERLSKALRKRIVKSSLPGSPDFVYQRERVAVFVHGCFWHKCPIHGKIPKTHSAYWRRKFERNAERDEIVRRELESMGWRVAEYWEHEVLLNSKAVAANIKSLVASLALVAPYQSRARSVTDLRRRIPRGSPSAKIVLQH